MKRAFAIASLLLLGGAGCAAVPSRTAPPAPAQAPAPITVENATYLFDGKASTLGGAQARLFGQPVYGDLNGDGKDDAAVLIVQDPGGSGTFYYVSAALNVNGDYQGLATFLLGDRVAPENVEIRDGQIIANYAERRPGEPMTALPSVGVSKYLRVDNGALKELTPPKPQ